MAYVSSLTITTETFSENTRNEYYKQLGKTDSQNKMKEYNVIFVGICRNVGNYIESNLQNIEKCAKKFNSFCVVIYENDSSDNTRELLQKNKKKNYHYIFEDNITEPRRTKRIERGRNKVLEKARELNKNNTYQFLVVLDLDEVNTKGEFVETIDTCFMKDDWDVLTANQQGIYYDLWALRNKDLQYDCWKEINDKQPECCHYKIRYEPSQFIEADSAFGGAAIYKLTSIPESCKYNGEHSNGMEKCEHVDFNKCIRDNGGKIYINTSFIVGTKTEGCVY
jgi:hypothetical protein